MLEVVLFQLGYLGLAIGAFLEGEVIVIVAGLLAHAGYLSIVPVIAVAMVATFIGDQFFFYVGQNRAEKALSHFPGLRRRVDRAVGLVSKHQNKVMATFRFLYGLRIATLIALGMSGVPRKKFVLWNIFNSVIWSSLFSLGGYYFGTAFEKYFQGVKHIERKVFIGIALCLAVLWLISIIRSYIKDSKQR
jgi:membrane protein DedA with SNARE-associated domain